MKRNLPNENRVLRCNLRTKRPKLRRKLIEKYSIRRYNNINRQRVKVTPKDARRQKQLRASKLEQREFWRCLFTMSNSSSALSQSEDRSTNNCNTDGRTANSPEPVIRPLLEVVPQPSLVTVQNDSDTARVEKSESDSDTARVEKSESDSDTARVEKSESDSDMARVEKSESDSDTARVEKSEKPEGDAAPNSVVASDLSINICDFMSGELTNMKFVHLEFYSYLTKISIQRKTAVARHSRKRKRKQLTAKPKKKKCVQPENNVVASLRDPYLTNWENLNSGKIEDEKNIAIIAYLGVGRPLFPVIHRNIITLCRRKDTQITDMWAEFALSTLIVQPSDRPRAKSILMPVVDDQLLSAVSHFNREQMVDYDEVAIRKVIRPRRSPSIDIETEPSVQSTNEKKKAARPSSKSRKSREKIGARTSRLIQQIHRRSLKNKKTVEPIEDSVIQKTPAQITDEELLRKHGFKPCRVVLPKLMWENFTLKLHSDPPKTIPSSSEKKTFNTSETTRSLSPRLTKTKLPINENDLCARKEADHSHQISPTKQVDLYGPEKNLPARRQKPPPPISRENQTAVFPAPTAATAAATTTTTIVRKKVAIQSQHSTIAHLNQTTSPPKSAIYCLKSAIARRQRVRYRLPSDAASKSVVALSPKKTVCTPPLNGKIPVRKIDGTRSAASLFTPNKELAFPGRSSPVGTDNNLPPKVPPSEQIEIFSDSVDDEEWNSMDHYFGVKHCSRTYGSMIHFTTRNRTFVYFYKMRRISTFQTKNNKYFQSCSYLRIQKSMEDDFVDVETINDLDYLCGRVKEEDAAEVSTTGPKSFKDILKAKGSLVESVPSNPLEILRVSKKNNAFGLSAVRNHDNRQGAYPFRSIEKASLGDLPRGKWIILRLVQEVVDIVFNGKLTFASKLLFEIMYRADLTKKIICHTVHEGSIGSVALYGIPGICDQVILGPWSAFEWCVSLQAVYQNDVGILETVGVPIVASRSLLDVNRTAAQRVEAVWWRPPETPLNTGDINAAYLNFLFKSGTGNTRESGISSAEVRALTIPKQHRADRYTHYRSVDGDDHYVLTHNSIRPYESQVSRVRSSPKSRRQQQVERRPHSTSVDAVDRRVLTQSLTRPNLTRPGSRSYPVNRTLADHSYKAATTLGNKTRRARKRPSSNSRSLTQEDTLPQKRWSSRSMTLNELNRRREQLRRMELKRSSALLNATVSTFRPTPSLDVALKKVVDEATDSIRSLERQDLGHEQEKAALMHRRKELLYKFLSCVNAMPDRSAAYTIARNVLSMLVPPRHADQVVEDGEKRLICPVRPTVRKLAEQPSYSVIAASPRRRRRRRQGRTTSPAAAQEYSEPSPFRTTSAGKPFQFKPVHVTVRSGNRVIGLGPYTEHSYCNFVADNAVADPVDDPLADTSVVHDLTDDTAADVDDASKSRASDGNKNNNPINICISENGEPIFKLVISRVSNGSINEACKPVQSGVEMKRLIQRILQQMLHKLTSDGSSNGAKKLNHVQLLQNIVSDSRNTRLFSEACDDGESNENGLNGDVISVDDRNYYYSVQNSRNETLSRSEDVDANTICKIKSVLSKAQNARNTEFRERFVSIDKLIEDNTPSASVGKPIENNTPSASRQRPKKNQKPKRPSDSVPSTSAAASARKECIIEEEFIDNSLPVEEVGSSGPSNDTNFLAPRQPRYVAINPKALMRSEPPAKPGFRTVPILRNVNGGRVPLQKTVPIILRKSLTGSNKCTLIFPTKMVTVPSTMKISSFDGNRVRCPSFVPATQSALPDSLRCSAADEDGRNVAAGAENATTAVPTCQPASDAANDDVTLVEHTATSPPISLESASNSNSVPRDNITVEGGNDESDAAATFRLSVKRFASLDTFKDGMCSNVDKLLKY